MTFTNLASESLVNVFLFLGDSDRIAVQSTCISLYTSEPLCRRAVEARWPHCGGAPRLPWHALYQKLLAEETASVPRTALIRCAATLPPVDSVVQLAQNVALQCAYTHYKALLIEEEEEEQKVFATLFVLESVEVGDELVSMEFGAYGGVEAVRVTLCVSVEEEEGGVDVFVELPGGESFAAFGEDGEVVEECAACLFGGGGGGGGGASAALFRRLLAFPKFAVFPEASAVHSAFGTVFAPTPRHLLEVRRHTTGKKRRGMHKVM